MIYLQKIKDSFLKLDTKDFYTRLIAFFVVLLCMHAGIIFYYFKATHAYKKEAQELYKKEAITQDLLIRLKKVHEQKEKIDEILNKEKNFKIKNFFEDIIQRLHLVSRQKGEVKLTEEDVLGKQYTQVTLQVQFQQINTQMLCEFLQALKEKERIYIKEVIITKSGNTHISAQILFATITSHSKKNKQEGTRS